MNNEMIEKLKKNEKPFGLLSLEEQECLRQVNKKKAVVVYRGPGKWKSGSWMFDSPQLVYSINPDYQPEPEPDPEYVDLEIVRDYQDSHDSWLGVWRKGHKFLPYTFTHLHCLPSLPNFNKFWFTDDLTGKECKVLYSDVSNARDQDNKVFARLRT